MRYRCLGPFHGISQGADPNFTPLELTFDEALRMKWRVRFWTIDVNIVDSGGTPTCYGSIIWAWNAWNNPDLPFFPPGKFAVTPRNEYELPIGWQMDGPPQDSVTGALLLPGLTNLSFFAPRLGITPTAVGAGCTFDSPDHHVLPFVAIAAGSAISSTTASSSVTGNIDGYPIDFDDFGLGLSGTFKMTPLSYWPCAIDDAHDPVVDATTGARLIDPHQTDDLPSDT